MVRFTSRKSTLNEVNGGHCRSRNNARYKGCTVVWEVLADDEPHFYVTTRKEAQELVDVLQQRLADWDGTGDLEAKASRLLREERNNG